MRRTLIAIAAAGALAAQEPGKRVQIEYEASAAAQADVMVHRSGGPGTFEFVAGEMAISGQPVKGAPYSADAVSETVQTLADGNRIKRTNKSSVARDGEGRTRRSHTLENIGPFVNSGQPVEMVSIDDPVAGAHYMLNSHDKTARKLATFSRVPAPPGHAAASAPSGAPSGVPGGAPKEVRTEVRVFTRHEGPPPSGSADFMLGVPAAEAPMIMHFRTSANAKRESLGKRNIEGVEVEGTRVTDTIPAGEIGNERPIETVSETWYSPKLKAVVESRRVDPRMGETTYRLTNISQSEPARYLFEVPADYKLVNDAPVMMRRKIEKKEDE